MTVIETVLNLSSGNLLTEIIAAALLAVLAAWGVLFHRYLRRAESANARITEIKPYFLKNSPFETSWLEVRYEFRAGNRYYGGKSVVPLSYFLHYNIQPEPLIMHDLSIDLPVLCVQELRIIGEELIEHELLRFAAFLPVLYTVRDPRKNFSPNRDFILEEKTL